MDHAGGSVKARHLCVLVHGLWGNPKHLDNVAKSLRKEHPADELYLFATKNNSGNFTVDGIERGGERVCAEIEDELKSISEKGGEIDKLSIIGYSLGGLVARYAVGLLSGKGMLDKLECMNFVTFASPHLGVRTPLKGWHNHVWNVLAARTLSASGRQLFTIDNFRDSGRPLLSVMTDPNSIFMSGLRKFKRHTLYANIVNDRTAVWYTTGIQKTDLFNDLDNVKVNYLKGWEDVIIDINDPIAPQITTDSPLNTFSAALGRHFKTIPIAVALTVIVPLGLSVFLMNSVVQTFRSSSRIRLHEKGEGGLDISGYRFPLWIQEMQGGVETAYEALNSAQPHDYLASEDSAEEEGLSPGDRQVMRRERRMSQPMQPTLALAADQFEMVDNLDTLKWRKYPVWIHNDRHSHAAIIVRFEKKTFDEGWVVLRHFAGSEFLI